MPDIAPCLVHNLIQLLDFPLGFPDTDIRHFTNKSNVAQWLSDIGLLKCSKFANTVKHISLHFPIKQIINNIQVSIDEDRQQPN